MVCFLDFICFVTSIREKIWFSASILVYFAVSVRLCMFVYFGMHLYGFICMFSIFVVAVPVGDLVGYRSDMWSGIGRRCGWVIGRI